MKSLVERRQAVVLMNLVESHATPRTQKERWWAASFLLISAILLLPGTLSAQLEPPLTGYSLVAPASCPDAQQYYTCSNTGNIAIYGLPSNIDYHFCPGLDCHIELCTASAPPATLRPDGSIASNFCNWRDDNPYHRTLFDFGSTYSDQAFTIYAEYRVYSGNTYYHSAATVWPTPPTQMTLNSSVYPSVTLTSPAGIQNDGCSGTVSALCAGGYQFQQLNINSSYQQAATYTASSSASPSESVNVSVIGCGTTCNTASPLVPYYNAPPYFVWWTGATAGQYTSLSLTATDLGGLQTTMQGPTALSLYDPLSAPATPATAPCGLPGSSSTVPCLAVADATGNFGDDITGDGQSCSDTNGYIFCGYADPSVVSSK